MMREGEPSSESVDHPDQVHRGPPARHPGQVHRDRRPPRPLAPPDGDGARPPGRQAFPGPQRLATGAGGSCKRERERERERERVREGERSWGEESVERASERVGVGVWERS